MHFRLGWIPVYLVCLLLHCNASVSSQHPADEGHDGGSCSSESTLGSRMNEAGEGFNANIAQQAEELAEEILGQADIDAASAHAHTEQPAGMEEVRGQMPDEEQHNKLLHGHKEAVAQELEQQLEGMRSKLADLGAQLQASRQQADVAQASIRACEQELATLEAAFVRLGGAPVGIASSMPWSGSFPYAGHTGPAGSGGAAEGHRTLMKAKGRTWPDLFLLLAAVQADAQVISAIPLVTDLTHATSPERPARFLALGDASGKVYIFTPRGDLLAEHNTGTTSGVTSMASFPLRRNESTLVTGHANGEVRMHGVVERLPPLRSAQRAAREAEEEDAAEQLEGEGGGHGGSIAQVYTWGALDPGQGVQGRQLDASETMQHVLEENGGTAPITLMQPFRSSSRAQAKRLVAIWDAAGRMRVQRDNGTIRFQAATNHTHLASTSIGAMVVSLTPTLASVQLQTLRSPPRAHVCKSLNGSRLVAAVFDPARPARAYAVNDRAQLLTMMVPHEHRTTTCKVLKVRSLPMLLPEGSSFDESTSQEACMSSTTSTDSRVSGTTSTDSRVSKTSSTSSSVPESGSTVDSGVPEGCGGHGAGGSSNSNGCGGGKSDGAGGAGDGGVRDEKQEGAIKGGESGAGGQCGVPAPLIQGPVLLAGLRGYLIMSSPRGVTVFNVSSPQLPPQEVITEPAASLAGLFGALIEVPPPDAATNLTNSPVHLLATSHNGGVLAVGLGSAKNGIVAMFESSMHVPPALTASKSASNRAPWLQPFVIGVAALLSLLFFKLRSRSSMGPMGLTPGGLAARRGKERLEGSLFAGGHRGTGRLADRGGMGAMGGLGGMGRGGMGGLGPMGFGGLGGRDGFGDMRGPLSDLGLHPLEGMGGLGRIPEEEEDMYKGYGGFPGPRSARRGLSMNVTPIQDDGEAEIEEDD